MTHKKYTFINFKGCKNFTLGYRWSDSIHASPIVLLDPEIERVAVGI